MDDYKRQAELGVIRNQVTSNFVKFVNYFFPLLYGFEFRWNWHHYRMCEYVERIVRGELQYLVVNIPPRYSKTEIWSIFLPAYGFVKNPKSSFINVSYNHGLTLRNSGFIQELTELDEFQALFPECALKKGTASKEQWQNISNGGFKAVSSGMGITGFGAGTVDDSIFSGAIILDDPNKPQDIDSDVMRTGVLDYFKSTLISRRNNEKVPIIVVMQRLHEEDLSGYCLSDDCPYPFEQLIIPVEAEDGEPLWESKHNKRDIQLLKKTMGAQFAGQYLQLPAPAEGGIFKDKYWKYYLPGSAEEPKEFRQKIIVADTAEGQEEQHDSTVLQCWGEHLNRAYLIDEIKFKADDEGVRNAADAFWLKHNPNFAVVEKKNAGTGLINHWKKAGKPVREFNPTKDKVARANAVIGYFENGYVYLPKEKEWLSDFLTECRNFPNAKHDDSVDCLTLAIATLLGGQGFMLYKEFSSVAHILQKCYKENLPLLISFNGEKQPAYIFAQVGIEGQLVILDSGVIDENRKDEIIRKAKTNQLINYNPSQNNFRVLCHEEKPDYTNPVGWLQTLRKEFGQSPTVHKISGAKNDIIDLTAKLMLENIVICETQEQERRLVIHPRNEALIQGLQGGLTFEAVERTGDVKPEMKIKEVYPYSSLARALHHLIYDCFLVQKSEQLRKNKKSISFRAEYNK